MPHIPAAHGISGCDTAAAYFGIGKSTVIKVLQTKQNISLNSIGDLNKPLDDCITEGRQFLLHCYGQKNVRTLNDARKRIWKSRISKNPKTVKIAAPKLQSLPPTDEAFQENLKRAHLQVAIWKQLLNENPPAVDIELYGWTKEQYTIILSLRLFQRMLA